MVRESLLIEKELNFTMEKLAIVGTGIAGMGAAWFLHKDYDVTIFEKNNYIGGHTNTVQLKEHGKDIFIDTGFMVFNKITYPNLTKLFDIIQAPVKKTEMSFSVQYLKSGLEYTGSGLNGLFAQRKNIFNVRFIKMLAQINRFNSECLELLNAGHYEDYTVKEYIEYKKYGDDFRDIYLLPMSSAVWSAPPNEMLNFPARTLVRFFHNHGFLGLNTQHQWYTLEGGSESYKQILIEQFRSKIRVNDGVKTIKRINGKIEIIASDYSSVLFDKVIFASHADETLKMIADPTEIEAQVLKEFKYQPNKATLHTDAGIMPKNKGVWSAWNYRVEPKNGETKASTIYYMNRLQGVSKTQDYFVSINDPGNIREDKIIREFDYDHPLFDLKAIEAQERLYKLNQQNNNTYFCGSYFKYGFHEDAFTSAVTLSNQLKKDLKW